VARGDDAMTDADPAAPARAFAPSMRGSNQQGMRQFNERIVLQAIRLHGAIPKADLARLTQLSTQTVSIIVERLLDDGLLVKQERVRGRIGQPSIPLSLNPEGAFSIGVQVGRRNTELLVLDFAGAVRHRQALQYDFPDPDTLLPNIAAMLKAQRRRLGDRWPRVVGLGLAAPLFMHQWADLLGPAAAPALAKWEGVDLRECVQAMTELPVVFAKDTIAACTAELLQGHGLQLRSFLYIFVGTFVGGGLVLSGHLLSGAGGNAGAIGSLPLGLAASGRPPQLLARASGWQLEQALIGAGIDPLLIFDDAINDAAHDALTAPWLASAADALAMTVTTASALLDLDAVVLDGSLSRRLLDRLLNRVRVALDAYPAVGIALPSRLELGRAGAHARALGGALLPLHTQFFPDKDIFLKQDA
jgi:predicted NBD/HSP70 family sugar kinase